MSALKIHLTCDADPDQATAAVPSRTQVTWDGLALLDKIAKEFYSRGWRWTLFMRADAQIRALLGKHNQLFDNLAPLLELLQHQGNEIGWHPHLTQFVKGEYLPLLDPLLACQQLVESFAEVRNSGHQFSSVRLGEAWQSNETMRLLSDLGFRVDSTAIPGRKRRDPVREFDWEPTPNHPYRPSSADYRMPMERDALAITEVPMSSGLIKTEYDTTPLLRYLNPSFHPALFRAGINDFLNSLPEQDTAQSLVLIFHPGELLEHDPNGLHAYGWKNFIGNIEDLCAELRARQLHFEFHCLRDAAL